jgi:hypothetical protein
MKIFQKAMALKGVNNDSCGEYYHLTDFFFKNVVSLPSSGTKGSVQFVPTWLEGL